MMNGLNGKLNSKLSIYYACFKDQGHKRLN